MDDFEALINESTRVDIGKPSKKPKEPKVKANGSTIPLRRPKRVNNAVREQAIEILKNADLNAKTTQQRHKGVIRKAVYSTEAAYEAFRHFEQALGGRKALIEVLQHCPENTIGYSLIQKLLLDPDFLEYAISKGNEENVRYSLSVLCSRHRIPLSAVVAAFRDSQVAKIAAETLMKVSSAAPKVVEQLIEDSQNRYEPCEVCEGLGRIWKINEQGEFELDKDKEHVTQLCGFCRGAGKKFIRHDVQNRKEFLKLAGLVQDKPLIAQTFNQQATFQPGDGSFEGLLRQVDTAIVLDAKKKKLKEIPNTIFDNEVIDAQEVKKDQRGDSAGSGEVA